MPALGSEMMDPTGETTLTTWITSPNVNGVLVLDKPAGDELGRTRSITSSARSASSARATAARSIRSRPACSRSASARRPSSRSTCSPTTRRTRRARARRRDRHARSHRRGHRASATRRTSRASAIDAALAARIAASRIRFRRCTRRSSRTACGCTSRRARGVEVERAPRRIRIDRFELLAFEPPRVRIAIACSKGTYVRSLVADLGRDLGCGAHLAELRRTRSGMFSIDEAQQLDRARPDPACSRSSACLRLPAVTVAGRARAVRSARASSSSSTSCPGCPREGTQFQLIDRGREARRDRPRRRPARSSTTASFAP